MHGSGRTLWTAWFITAVLVAGGVVTSARVVRATELPGWKIVAAPAGARFVAADAVASDDAWMVGTDVSGVPRSIAYHWDGDAWSADAGATAGDWSQFDGVDARTSTDVWVVGSSSGSSFTRHWDGDNWDQDPAPFGTLLDIEMTGASDGWAVGARTGSVGGQFMDVPVYARWNGTGWADVVPPFTVGGILTSVAATSATDVWAGGYRIDVDADPRPFMSRWNGTAWSEVALPDVGIGRIDGMTAVSGEVYAVGWHRGASDTVRQTMVLRRSGGAWTQEEAPELGDMDNGLQDVAGSSTTDLWAVGSHRVDENFLQSLIVHRTGTGWSISLAANELPLSPTGYLTAVSAIGGDAWAGGRVIQAFGSTLPHDSTVSINAGLANWGETVPITGTLTFSRNGYAGQREVTISRAPVGGAPVVVAAVVTTNSGTFAFADDPPVRGEFDYTAAFAGDDVWDPSEASDTGRLFGLSTALRIRASKQTIRFGQAVTLRAHLGRHVDNDVVKIFAKEPGETMHQVASGPVDADGDISVTLRPKRNTTYTARFSGDSVYEPRGSEPVDVDVRVIVIARAVNRDATGGVYAIYRYSSQCRPSPHRNCPTLTAVVKPQHDGKVIYSYLQAYLDGGWHTVGDGYTRLNAQSRSTIVFFYRDRSVIGVRFRARFLFPEDSDHLEGQSSFVYFKVSA